MKFLVIKGIALDWVKPTLGMDGYYLITLTQRLGRKKSKCVAIHKLVAFAYRKAHTAATALRSKHEAAASLCAYTCCTCFYRQPTYTNGQNKSHLLLDHKDENKRKQKTYAHNNSGNTVHLKPSDKQLRHREASLKSINKARQNPERLEEIRNYKKVVDA